LAKDPEAGDDARQRGLAAYGAMGEAAKSVTKIAAEAAEPETADAEA
jgi:hypothetical protein